MQKKRRKTQLFLVFFNILIHILFINSTQLYIPNYSTVPKLQDILQVSLFAVTVVHGGYTFLHVLNIIL